MAKQYVNTDTGEESESIDGLQGVNKTKSKYKNVVTQDVPAPTGNPEYDALDQKANQFFNKLKYNPREALTDESANPTDYVGGNGFGESEYDSAVKNESEREDLGNTRALEQPWYDKIGAGILKGTVLAGTTLADGLIGTIAGLGNMAKEGTMDSFVENPFSVAMQDINKWSEEALPNYQTDVEKQNEANGQWYNNIFTANFLGGQLKNLGFMVGAGLAGEITGGLTASLMGLNDARMAFEGAAAVGKTYEDVIGAYKSGDAILDGITLNKQLFAAAKTLKNAEPVIKLAGGLAGSLGWARQSAITDSQDWFNTQQAKIGQDREAFSDKIQGTLLQDPEYYTIAETGDPTNPYAKVLNQQGQSVLDKQVSDRYNSNLQKATDDRIKMSNVDFAINLPLLTGAEIFQFGKAYAGGYKNARKLAPFIEKTIGEEGESYAAKLPSKLQQYAKMAANPLVAGNQLMMMNAVATGVGNKFGDELDNFLSGKIDNKSTESTDQYITSIASNLVQGAKDVYGNPSKWEQFIIGAFAGVVGIPSFKDKVKADGSVGKSVTMNGGIWDEMREHKTLVPEVNELVDKLNSRVQDPEFINRYQGLIRHNHLEEAKSDAAQKGDEFAYKNFEHSQLVSDAILFDKAGRIQDLYDNVDKASTLKPEDVKQVRELSINKETGKSVFDNMTDKEVIDQVKKQGEDTKATIDNYRKVSDALKTKTGGQLKDDELEEMTWMLTKIDNWESRFQDMYKEVKDKSSDLLQTFRDKTYKDEDNVEHPITDVLDMPPVLMLSALQHFNIGDVAKLHSTIYANNAESIQKEADTQQSVLDTKAASANKRGINSVKGKLDRLTEAIRSNKETSVKYGNLADKMEDMGRLAKARNEFIDKYDGYTRNPDALRAMLNDTKEAVVKETEDKKVADISTKVNTAKTYKDFKDTVNSAESPELKRKVIDEAVANNNPIAAEYKKVSKGLNDLYPAIDNVTNITPEQRSLARRILKAKSDNIEDLKTLLDKNTYSNISEDNLWVNPNTGETTDSQDMQKAQNAIGAAINSVLKSTKVEDKIKDFANSESVAANTPEVPEENIPNRPDKPTLVGGNVTTKDLLDGNRDINTIMEPSNTPANTNTGSRDWIQVIHEIDLDRFKNSGEIAYIGDLENKSAYHTIYNYVKDNGGFDYVNKGQLKAGSKVEFMIDPAWEKLDTNNVGTVFITQNGVVLGAIDRSANRMSQFAGMSEFAQRVRNEFDARENKDDTKFISKETNDVSKVFSGRIPFRKSGDIERFLGTIPGIKDGDTVSKKVIFGIMQKGQLITNKTGVNTADIKGLDIRGGNNDGRLYLLVEGADGKYYPTLVKTKRFNSTEFNLNDPTIQNTQRYKSIIKIATDMCSATDPEEFTRHFNTLNNELYLGDFHINYNEDGDGSITVRKDTADAGPQTKILTRDPEKVPELASDFSSNGPVLNTDIKEGETGDRPINEVVNDVLNAIQKDGTYLQIDKDAINRGEYNDKLINDNILSSNIDKLGVVGAGFEMKGKDKVGEILKTEKVEVPKLITPATSVTESKGTEVNYSGKYTVTSKGDILNDKGVPVNQLTESKSQIIKDIAWITELNSGQYGKNIGDKKVTMSWDSKAKEADYYLTPSGRILKYRDGIVDRYVIGHEEEAVKKSFGKKDVLSEVTKQSTPLVTSSAITNNSIKADIDKTTYKEYHAKFEDLDTNKDETGYYLNSDNKVVKDYVRPLGTFMSEGDSIPMHVVKDFYSGKEVFMGIIDANGKTAGKADSIELLRETIDKNKSALAERAKEETIISSSIIPKSNETTLNQVKPIEVKPDTSKPFNPTQGILGDDLLSSMNKKPRRPKASEVDTKSWQVWDQPKEIEHLNKILPNIVRGDLLKIHKGLIEVNKGGAAAWGIYKDGLMVISDIASKGTVYHEAFHLVMDKFTSSSEKAALFAEARGKWGRLSESKLEENMANAYKNYTLTEVADKSLGRRIIDFFKTTLGLSKTNTALLDKFFWDINKGKYADKEITSEFKNKSVKSLDNSDNLHTFANLDSNTRDLLSKKGIDLEVWNNLNKDEKINELKCISI